MLTTDGAEIRGEGEARANLFAGKRNIGWWDFDSQWLEWKIDVERAGSYRVGLEYARPGAEAVDMELQLGGTTLASPVAGTGGWDRWKKVELGSAEVSPGEAQVVVLRAVDPPSEGVINFVELTLTPER